MCDYLSILGLKLNHVSKGGPKHVSNGLIKHRTGDKSEESANFHKLSFYHNYLISESEAHVQRIQSFKADDHDDVIKLKHFPRYWPFGAGIHRSPVGGFPSQRSVAWSFDVFFDLHLSKQTRRRWFETLSRSLWRHCNVPAIVLDLEYCVEDYHCYIASCGLFFQLCFTVAIKLDITWSTIITRSVLCIVPTFMDVLVSVCIILRLITVKAFFQK